MTLLHADRVRVIQAKTPNLTRPRGGGTDDAIDRRAGPRRLAEYRTRGGCPTGKARVTAGYDFPATHVIRTGGTVWHGGEHSEDDDLAHGYRNSLAIAVKHGIKTIAFPEVSTCVYCFPLGRATTIAVREMGRFFTNQSEIDGVTSCCFARDAVDLCECEMAGRRASANRNRAASAPGSSSR